MCGTFNFFIKENIHQKEIYSNLSDNFPLLHPTHMVVYYIKKCAKRQEIWHGHANDWSYS